MPLSDVVTQDVARPGSRRRRRQAGYLYAAAQSIGTTYELPLIRSEVETYLSADREQSEQ